MNLNFVVVVDSTPTESQGIMIFYQFLLFLSILKYNSKHCTFLLLLKVIHLNLELGLFICIELIQYSFFVAKDKVVFSD